MYIVVTGASLRKIPEEDLDVDLCMEVVTLIEVSDIHCTTCKE